MLFWRVRPSFLLSATLERASHATIAWTYGHVSLRPAKGRARLAVGRFPHPCMGRCHTSKRARNAASTRPGVRTSGASSRGGFFSKQRVLSPIKRVHDEADGHPSEEPDNRVRIRGVHEEAGRNRAADGHYVR